MSNPIIRLKKSGEKDKAPTSLAQGELAVNYNVDSPALYIQDSDGNVIKLADAGAAVADKVQSVDGEAPIIVDNDDPLNPIIKFDDAPDGGLDGTRQYVRQVETTGGSTSNSKAWAEIDTYSKTDADGRYLRIDADAPDQTRVAGETSFAELTEHEGGVLVSDNNVTISNGGLKVTGLGMTNKSVELSAPVPNNYANALYEVCGTYGTTWENPTTLTTLNHFSAAGAPAAALANRTKIDTVRGFYVNSGMNAGPNNQLGTENSYGFYSELADIAGAKVYNFYAEGTAPNYFAGNTNFQGDSDFQSFPQAGKWGAFFADGQLIIKNQPTSAGGNRSPIRVCRAGASANGDFITFHGAETNSSIGRIFNDGGTVKMQGISTFGVGDYRQFNLTAFTDSASDTVKLLNPGTNGFIAHQLEPLVPQAVYGTKDETEAIGTLVDWDGTELETDVVEPSAEELTYTEEVETDGVATMVTRTRSWNATGSRDVYQGVDQTKLIPLLTKALQEVIAKNEDLEARLAALEGA